MDEALFSIPILNRLTDQTVNVDELDYLAKRLDSFDDDEIIQFQAMAAVLSLSDIKDPINLTFCCQQTKVLCIAEDIDNYELVDDTEGTYTWNALHRTGAGDEIFDLLDGYTDYERMGRAMMEDGGVQATSLGQVKRLSSPFPQQSEMGQMMY